MRDLLLKARLSFIVRFSNNMDAYSGITKSVNNVTYSHHYVTNSMGMNRSLLTSFRQSNLLLIAVNRDGQPYGP
jgi:hypothetical protein